MRRSRRTRPVVHPRERDFNVSLSAILNAHLAAALEDEIEEDEDPKVVLQTMKTEAAKQNS